MSHSEGTGPTGRGPKIASDFPQLGERYTILRKLGGGGQGNVWLAQDHNLAIEVAIKVLLTEYRGEEFIKRLTFDAQSAVRITAPNVVRIYDYDREFPYLVMEYCDGGDLLGFIKSRRRRSVTEIVSVVRQVCDALIAAHESDPPLVHRDLKPGNVLFKKGQAKVADFGLAKALGGGAGLTTTRGMMGTIGYASPEQLRDASRVDHRTDLWALGVILYEMLTWRRPFDRQGDEFVNVALRVRLEPPFDPPYDVPDPLMRTILRALQKEPAERYQSAREVAADLDAAVAAISGANAILLPPKEMVDEVSQRASEVASLVEQGKTAEAAPAVRALVDLAPDDSLARYWERRFRQAKQDSSSGRGAGVDIKQLQYAEWLESRIHSIKSLMQGHNYREARKQIGELLLEDPNNTIAQRLLDAMNEEEGRLRSEINRAHDDADRARAAEDWRKVHEIWRSFSERHPTYSDAKTELAVAKAQLESFERKIARERVSQEAARHEASGDLAAALATWRAYVETYPQDKEATTERDRIGLELRTRERVQRIETLRAEAASRRSAGDLEGALAAWAAVLREDPASEEARRQQEALRREIVERDHERAFAAAAAAARAAAAAGQLDRAIETWRQHLVAYPDDRQARGDVEVLENERTERQRARVLRRVELERRRVETKVANERFKSLDRETVATLTRSVDLARRAATMKLPEIEPALRELVVADGKAEELLATAVRTSRSALIGAVDRSRALLEDQTDAELDRALEAAATVLGAPCSAWSSGDPLAPLETARRGLDTAIKETGRRREVARAASRKIAAEAVERARSAVGALRTLMGDAGATAVLGDLGWLDSRSGDLTESAARVLADRAEALDARAEAARQTGLRELLRDGGSLLGEAMALQLSHRSKRLDELCTGVASVLNEPTGDAACSKLPALVRDLRVEADVARKTVEKRLGSAQAAWQQSLAEWKRLLQEELDVTWKTRGEEIHQAATTAVAGTRIEELEARTRQLVALTRWCRLQCRWIEDGPSIEEAEGVIGPDGVPPALEPGVDRLLGEYRKHLAAGTLGGLQAAARAVAEHVAGSRESEGPGRATPLRVPKVDPRVRKFNERYHPTGLERFDQVLAKGRATSRQGAQARSAQVQAELDAAFDALLSPPPVWRRALPYAVPVVLLVVAASLGLTRATLSKYAVTVINPEGAVLSGVFRGEEQVKVPSVGDSPTTWELFEGSYEARLEGGGIAFKVPSDDPVILLAKKDLATDLVNALGLDRSGQP